MALHIEDPEAERLARELAAATGETLTQAILNALRERIARQRQKRPTPRSVKQILIEAQRRLSRIPVRDNRPADEILGYDEKGLPH
ncbi:MAG: type II toxin-antitoxin system VapB family antitoxin [Acidobacteriia bacterium]|nr:type II toxin-antitoxin system VapB family antitoxin [Terriglobia bacterium]